MILVSRMLIKGIVGNKQKNVLHVLELPIQPQTCLFATQLVFKAIMWLHYGNSQEGIDVKRNA